MFLASCMTRAYGIFASWCVLATALVGRSAKPADLQPHCFLDLPTYDAVGNRLTSKIVAVSLHDERLDLLTNVPKEVRLTADGNRLYFSENLIGKRPLDITVSDEAGRRIKRPVVLTACQQ